GIKLFIPPDDLFEFGMREAAFDSNDDGLGHFVGDNFADAFFARGPGERRSLGWGRRSNGGAVRHTKLAMPPDCAERKYGFQFGRYRAAGCASGRVFQVGHWLAATGD